MSLEAISELELMTSVSQVTKRAAVFKIAGLTVPVIAGVILIAAAFMKAIYPVRPLWLAAWPSTIAMSSWALLASIEMGLGMALVVRSFPRVTLRLAAVWYGILSLYSIFLIAKSADSCGCFGKLVVPPWASAAVDAVLALVLFAFGSAKLAAGGLKFPRVRMIIWFVASLFAAGLVITLDPSRAANKDGLWVDDHYADIGVVNALQARSIVHEFSLVNQSAYPITIAKIDHTCTCTKASASQTVIDPGKSSVIRATIDWSNRHGRQFTGLYVTTSKPARTVMLTITGIVDTGVAISPSFLNFGALMADTVASRLVYVTRTDGRSDLPLRFASPLAGIAVAPTNRGDLNALGAWYSITLTGAKLPHGQHDERIEFLPQDPQLPKLSLPVHFNVLDDLVSLTPSIRFSGKPGEILAAHFRRNSGAESPTFTIVDPSDPAEPRPFIIARVDQPTAGNYLVEIKFLGTGGSRVFRTLVAQSNGRELANVSLCRF